MIRPNTFSTGIPQRAPQAIDLPVQIGSPLGHLIEAPVHFRRELGDVLLDTIQPRRHTEELNWSGRCAAATAERAGWPATPR